MDLERLRSETRAEHEATESVVPLMDPGLTRAGYTAVLQRMHAVVSAWEIWAAAHAPAELAPLVGERRRSPLIEADLAFLGAGPAAHTAPYLARLPWLEPKDSPEDFTAAFLGAMYVMEGSTLGGQYIARHVEEALGFAPGVGDAYFRGYGERTGLMWRQFKAVLAELPDDQADSVVASAKAMFGYFGAGMRMQGTPTDIQP